MTDWESSSGGLLARFLKTSCLTTMEVLVLGGVTSQGMSRACLEPFPLAWEPQERSTECRAPPREACLTTEGKMHTSLGSESLKRNK